jgi:hypothetical protein
MRYFVLILLIPLALCAQAVTGRRAGATPPPPPPPTPAADLASLEGQVLNALGGTPLRKATVRLNGGPAAAGARNTYSATTDGSGRFAIGGVEPGTYSVNASHTGFLGMNYNARSPGAGGTPLELGRAQKSTGIDFRLVPQGVVTGKITDEDGDPMENVQVQLMHLVLCPGQEATPAGKYRVHQRFG